LIAAGGPWLSILGSVFTDKVIVQRLTDMKWMTLSSTEDDSRVYHNTKVFFALRECLDSLEQFYNGLSDTSTPFVDHQPYSRYFPYPTSFTARGETTQFRYLKSLEDDAACVTYLAEEIETGATGVLKKMVVKFVARYGEKVHTFLADNGHAPTLRYYGPLPNAQLSGASPKPVHGVLRSNIMQMIVMDYIEPRENYPQDALQQISTILKLLHKEGYVFGDLRTPNILFDNDDKVKLIDFNWSGRYLRDERQGQINDGEDYARYPLSMSTVDGMWAEGMKPLRYILPNHDWDMFKRLQYP
jgi:hypothetical protein